MSVLCNGYYLQFIKIFVVVLRDYLWCNKNNDYPGSGLEGIDNPKEILNQILDRSNKQDHNPNECITGISSWVENLLLRG